MSSFMLSALHIQVLQLKLGGNRYPWRSRARDVGYASCGRACDENVRDDPSAIR